MPAEAALQQLGIQADDSELQDKKNYFKRMAVRCKEKFDADGKQSTDGSLSFYSEEEGSDTQSTKSSSHRYHHRHPHLHMRHYLQALHCHFHPQTLDETPLQDSEQAQFVPKVDPKETKAAHRAIYHHGQANVNNSDDDDEEDRKLFGSWWGCHSKRSRTEKLLDKQLDNEWEKIDLPKSAEEKRKSLGERNGGLPGNTFSDVDPKRPWWKQGTQNAEIVVARGQSAHTQDRKVAAKRHQAIAAAAVKEYHARRARQGKKVSHGEMKAILAGMAMAEAVKLLESHCGDDSGEGNGEKDETVAEAGSVALKLFELMR
ncbi:hypothetical protein BC939DRAFT_196345 [Gamsiella multidivaricata]|uniref:uncharacterized protein n=1 Tax=Gamsiella multidivaricata TaxID=101098 RepID=UPI00221F1D18|nr:uncharacterized protein BC939DRAFT_196345 [Gamsiella multidivaricata]KAI7822041.1 hypothetical protein BC939DRAFT_196345 [Gamsiella multidivaricata]